MIQKVGKEAGGVSETPVNGRLGGALQDSVKFDAPLVIRRVTGVREQARLSNRVGEPAQDNEQRGVQGHSCRLGRRSPTDPPAGQPQG